MAEPSTNSNRSKRDEEQEAKRLGYSLTKTFVIFSESHIDRVCKEAEAYQKAEIGSSRYSVMLRCIRQRERANVLTPHAEGQRKQQQQLSEDDEPVRLNTRYKRLMESHVLAQLEGRQPFLQMNKEDAQTQVDLL